MTAFLSFYKSASIASDSSCFFVAVDSKPSALWILSTKILTKVSVSVDSTTMRDIVSTTEDCRDSNYYEKSSN